MRPSGKPLLCWRRGQGNHHAIEHTEGGGARMGLPTAAQIHRHDQFFQQYMVALASVALAGHELYGRGAVIVNEVDQTMRYQGGGRWAVRGRRWQRERLWVTRYDPDQQMIIIINNLEGNHSSYFLGLPV